MTHSREDRSSRAGLPLGSPLLLVLLLALTAPAVAQDRGPPAGATDEQSVDSDAAAVAADEDEPEEVDLSRFMSLSEADVDGPRGVRVNAPEAYAGYTLYGPLNSTTIYLIDMAGDVVHQWDTDVAPGAWCYLLDDGSLLRCGREDETQFAGGGIGGQLRRLAPDGTVLWQWDLADGQRQQHHDIEPLPNGNILLITWNRVAARDALRRGRDPRQVDRERGLWPDVVLEIRPVGRDDAEVVWEWHAWDHVVQDFDERASAYGAVADHPELIDVNADHRDAPVLTEDERREQEELEEQMAALGYVGGEDEEDGEADGPPEKLPGDWLHTNAVAYEPTHDLIALSTPHMSEVWVIDHGTTTEEAAGHTGGRRGRGGDLLWRWGNPRMYGAGGDADRRLFYQHDPSWVAGEVPGELRLLVFNNGRGRTDGDYSSVDELILPFDPESGFRRPDDGAFGPAAPAWSYSAGDDFYSAFISGAQRLPNGNTLIASGAPGRIFEVTRDGRVVWDYRNPHGGEIEPPEHAGRAPPLAIFRATRLSADHPGIAALLR